VVGAIAKLTPLLTETHTYFTLTSIMVKCTFMRIFFMQCCQCAFNFIQCYMTSYSSHSLLQGFYAILCHDINNIQNSFYVCIVNSNFIWQNISFKKCYLQWWFLTNLSTSIFLHNTHIYIYIYIYYMEISFPL